MEKIICRGRFIQELPSGKEDYTNMAFELKTPTAEEIERLEDGDEVLAKLKLVDDGHLPARSLYAQSIVYIFPKTAQKDELDELKFFNTNTPYNSAALETKNIMDRFDKLIDIIKQMERERGNGK